MLHQSFIPLVKVLKRLTNKSKCIIIQAIANYLMDFYSVYKSGNENADETGRKAILNDRNLETIFECFFEEIDKIEDVFEELSQLKFA